MSDGKLRADGGEQQRHLTAAGRDISIKAGTIHATDKDGRHRRRSFEQPSLTSSSGDAGNVVFKSAAAADNADTIAAGLNRPPEHHPTKQTADTDDDKKKAHNHKSRPTRKKVAFDETHDSDQHHHHHSNNNNNDDNENIVTAAEAEMIKDPNHIPSAASSPGATATKTSSFSSLDRADQRTTEPAAAAAENSANTDDPSTSRDHRISRRVHQKRDAADCGKFTAVHASNHAPDDLSGLRGGFCGDGSEGRAETEARGDVADLDLDLGARRLSKSVHVKSKTKSKKKKGSSRKRNVQSTTSRRESETETIETVDSRQHLGSGYQLTTDNPEIKEWLRRKNKIIRKRRLEERNAERQRKREEEAKRKEAETRREESAQKIQTWLIAKRLEEKLLRQRQSQQQEREQTTTMASKVSAVINQTFDLKPNTDVPIVVTVTSSSRPKVAEEPAPAETASSSSADHPDALPLASGTAAQTAASGSAWQLPADQHHHHRRHQQQQQQHLSASVSAKQRVQPSRITLPHDDDVDQQATARQQAGRAGRQPSQHRISFEDWLSRKRADDQKRSEEIARQQRDIDSQLDPTTRDLVSNLARRRISLIIDGKRRIDTGIKKVDDEANAYPKVRAAGGSVYKLQLELDDVETTNKKKAADECVTVSARTSRNEVVKTSRGDARASLHTWRPTLDFARPVGKSAAQQTEHTISSTPRSGSCLERFERSSVTAEKSQRERRTASAALARSGGDCVDQVGVNHVSLTVTKLHAVPPRPPKPNVYQTSAAYAGVRYQQRPWNSFSDYVWDRLNVDETEGGETKQRLMLEGPRPDPVGSDLPDCPLTAEATAEADVTMMQNEKRGEAGKERMNTDMVTQTKELGIKMDCSGDVASASSSWQPQHQHHHHQQQKSSNGVDNTGEDLGDAVAAADAISPVRNNSPARDVHATTSASKFSTGGGPAAGDQNDAQNNSDDDATVDDQTVNVNSDVSSVTAVVPNNNNNSKN